MTQINMHEAKTHLSRYVERVAAGEEIIIARAGKPVMKLVPYEQGMAPRQFGQLAEQLPAIDDAVWFDRDDELEQAFAEPADPE